MTIIIKENSKHDQFLGRYLSVINNYDGPIPVVGDHVVVRDEYPGVCRPGKWVVTERVFDMECNTANLIVRPE